MLKARDLDIVCDMALAASGRCGFGRVSVCLCVRTVFFCLPSWIRYLLSCASCRSHSGPPCLRDKEFLIPGVGSYERIHIWNLFPHPSPDGLRAWNTEFERRIRDLSLFDHVEATVRGRVLVVNAKQKSRFLLS